MEYTEEQIRAIKAAAYLKGMEEGYLTGRKDAGPTEQDIDQTVDEIEVIMKERYQEGIEEGRRREKDDNDPDKVHKVTC